MPLPSATSPSASRLPVLRLVLLGVVILAGMALFFAFATRTHPVVTPATVEAAP